MKIKNVLFDFDGVILDSNAIKDDAFRYVLRDFSADLVDVFIEYHQQNGAVSRYEKINFFFNEILNRKPEKRVMEKMFSEFSFYTLDKLTDKKLIIQETFEFIKNTKYNLHIVSATDEEDLKFICDKLGLQGLFLSIHGSPKIKSELIFNILDTYDYRKDQTALIGDSRIDYEAACVSGISFYGYNNLNLKVDDVHYLHDYSLFLK